METGAGTERHARLLGLAEVLTPSLNGVPSYRLARLVEAGLLEAGLIEAGLIEAGVFGRAEPSFGGLALDGLDEQDREWVTNGMARVDDRRVRHWQDELDRLAARGVQMVDAADDGYPVNLRMVHDRPPFLMVRGVLDERDVRAVAVVGTRQASPEGRQLAFELARRLAERDVTVVSGLAAGVDTAAHGGALTAGGRTIAVLPVGIDAAVYPEQNRALAGAVARSGACVSQFWPRMRPVRWGFPVRNHVTSGLSLGSVVVEAEEGSGARLHAEATLRHGKRLFLLARLVRAEPWAAAMAERPEVVTVDSATAVDQVVAAVEVDLVTDAPVVA